MINFSFYTRIKETLANGVFDARDYTPQGLQILSDSLPVIYSEYCGEEFRRGALEYLEANKELYPYAHARRAQDFHPLMTLESLAEEGTIAREIIAGIEGIVGNEAHFTFSENMNARLVKYIQDNPIHVKDAAELGNYYSKWLCTQKGYNPDFLFLVTFVTAYFTNEKEEIEFLFEQLGENENFEKILATKLNISQWKIEHVFEKFFLLQDEEKDFYQNLIAAKGWPALTLMLKLFEDLEKTSNYFSQLIYDEEYSGDSSIGATESRSIDWKAIKEIGDIERIFTDLSRLVEIDANYPEVDFGLSATKGFDLNNFKKLAAKYEMPAILAEKVMNDEMENFHLDDDNVGQILRDVFREFNLSATKIPRGGPNSGYTLNVQSKRALYVELTPKTDPTALFMGRMTSSCQFYTGNSSDQAVIPFYTDPNIGLLAIKEGTQVVAGSLVWLCNDERGTGIVLESFVHRAENYQKAYLPFVTQLAGILSHHNINLYMGTGGKSPTLKIAGELVEPLPQPAPLTAEYKPYGDSRSVYLIQPGIEYEAIFRESEEVTTDKIIELLAGLPENILEKLMALPNLRKIILEHDYNITLTKEILSKLTEENLNLLISLDEENLFQADSLFSIQEALKIIENLGAEKILKLTVVPTLLKAAIFSHTDNNTMKLLSRLNEEDIAKLRMWEENTEADYSRISINHLLTQLRTLSIGAIERILEDPALIQMLESSMIALPGPVEEISEAILDLSREDIENLQSWNSLTSPNHKINIFTLKSFVAISRAIASEVLNELAELKWIDFKAAFNVASDRITTITINAKGIAPEDIEIINSLSPEDITKLKLFNSCPEEALAEAGIASLVSFARKFSSAGLEILVRLPDILSHLSAEPEHLIKLAELFEVHNHKFKFFDHDILYSRPEKLDAISLFLNSCDLDQLDSLKNLGILARIRFEDNIDIYKCLEFLVKSNEEKLAAIIEDDQVYSILPQFGIRE